MIEYRKFRVANIVITQECDNLIFDGENHAQNPSYVMFAMLKVSSFLEWWKVGKTRSPIQNVFLNTEDIEWATWKGLDLVDLQISNSKIFSDCNFKRNNKSRIIYIDGVEKMKLFKTGNVKFACFNKKDFKPLVNSILYNAQNAQKIFLTRFSIDVLDFLKLERVELNFTTQKMPRGNFDTGAKLVYKVCNNMINKFNQDVTNLEKFWSYQDKNKLNMGNFDLKEFKDKIEMERYNLFVENEMKKNLKEHFPVAYEVTM